MKLPRSALVVLSTCLVLAHAELVAQSAPKLLPFQGYLTDATGQINSDGARLIQFRVYDAPIAGSAVWAGEVHRTTVNGGLVNVILGSKTSLDSIDFDRTLYLEITVDADGDNAITASDPPLLPRQALLPSVFAKESADSRLLAGRDWTPLFGVNSPDGPIPGSKLAAASITAGQIASNTLTSNQIAELQVDTRILADQAVSSVKLADAAVTAEKIAAKTIVLTNLSADLLRILNPPGTVVAFAGETNKVPGGWLLCDGRTVSTNQYPELYEAISTNWGVGSPGWFALPDLRGVFLRGVSGSRSDQFADPGDNRTQGNRVGSFQTDAFRTHQHTFSYDPTGGWNAGGIRIDASDRAQQGSKSTSSVGGTETRPKNAYVNYIIKY